VTRTKGLAGNLENTEEDLSLNQEENTQGATVEKNENMKKNEKLSPISNFNKKQTWSTITTGNQFITTAGSPTINYTKRTRNIKYDLGKHKKKERKNAKQNKQADHVPGENTTHPRQNKGHTDKHPPSPTEEADDTSRTTYSTGQIKRPTPIDKVTEGTSTSWTAHQPPYTGASGPSGASPLTCKR
jgi:hypothetical protein